MLKPMVVTKIKKDTSKNNRLRESFGLVVDTLYKVHFSDFTV